jgi:transposase, IS30 family
MRDRRRTPAGGVQAEKQQRYVQLIAQGVSNSEACRLVGIDRKTGNRWRYGRKVRNSAGALVIYAPVKITKPNRGVRATSQSRNGSRSPISGQRG